MEQAMLITMSAEDFRTIVREEVAKAVVQKAETKELPHFLTRDETMKLLRISETKMSELMGRKDFPVCREFGVKIYTEKLFEWVARHTSWVEENTKYLRSIS